jgi:hypothetical protein
VNSIWINILNVTENKNIIFLTVQALREIRGRYNIKNRAAAKLLGMEEQFLLLDRPNGMHISYNHWVQQRKLLYMATFKLAPSK